MRSAVIVPPEAVRRILICQLRQIGDVLLATPSLELLARHYPTAEIHAFTEKKCVPMLQGNPHIHKIWPLDKKALPSLVHELVFYRHVAAVSFDVIVDFQQLPRCRWVVGFSRAKVRLSFSPPWYLRFLYT
ncbi:MAG: glycosyltransferase family 9 protein, partial [Desulfovibrio sp.]|nr:glycosyltransferase family 9 protein [Desulfovibrio sp.]